jgi:hypothetical protein
MYKPKYKATQNIFTNIIRTATGAHDDPKIRQLFFFKKQHLKKLCLILRLVW